MRTLVVMLFLLFALSRVYADDIPQKKHVTKGAVIRSMIPGWGQLYNEKYLKAVTLFGGSLSVGLAAHMTDSNRIKNDLSWIALGFYVYNLLDAYVDAHLFLFDEQMEESILAQKVLHAQ